LILNWKTQLRLQSTQRVLTTEKGYTQPCNTRGNWIFIRRKVLSRPGHVGKDEIASRYAEGENERRRGSLGEITLREEGNNKRRDNR